MPTVADVTVVIPTYNRRERLHRVLSALARQAEVGFEVVVFSDGSTDDTDEYLPAGGSGSQRERVFVPGASGLGVVADVAVALVGGLGCDGEGVGDLLPGGAGVAGAADELVLCAGDRGGLFGGALERSEGGIAAGAHQLINLG